MVEQRTGKLKIFMGYAAGVGKTYQCWKKPSELKAQGVDVVIGYFEPHGRKDTIARTEGLETIPRRRGRLSRIRPSRRWTRTRFWRAIPRSALVDEFPHTNVPGSERLKRGKTCRCFSTPASTSSPP